MQKKGMSKTQIVGLVAIVVALILLANMAPTALIGLFNTTAFCPNASLAGCVPSWVPTVLGILGVVALIFVVIKLYNK